jgi:hypothetical protein
VNKTTTEKTMTAAAAVANQVDQQKLWEVAKLASNIKNEDEVAMAVILGLVSRAAMLALQTGVGEEPFTRICGGVYLGSADCFVRAQAAEQEDRKIRGADVALEGAPGDRSRRS